MPATLIKPRQHSNNLKPKIKQEVNITKSYIPSHLQSIKQKLSSGNGFVEHQQNILIDTD